MATRTRWFVVVVVVLIVVVAVAALLLRGRMRCAGFGGPGVSADELPRGPAAEGNLRVAMWNIRNFPLDERPQHDNLGFSRHTNICDLQESLTGLDADLLGLCEVCDTKRFPPILRRSAPGRAYQVLFAARGGRFGQHVGLAWDDHRLERVGELFQLGDVDLDGSLRPAVASYVRSRRTGGVDFTVVQVHLAAAPWGYDSRIRQYEVLAEWVVQQVVKVQDEDVLVIGDFNTTGAEGGSYEEEMEVLDRIMAEAGLQLFENATGCTEYWEGRGQLDGVQVPALLDQVYYRSFEELDRSVPLESWLHCRREACRELMSIKGAEDGTFWDVSDHCPVTFEIRDVDLD